jgi:hypothetical protein
MDQETRKRLRSEWWGKLPAAVREFKFWERTQQDVRDEFEKWLGEEACNAMQGAGSTDVGEIIAELTQRGLELDTGWRLQAIERTIWPRESDRAREGSLEALASVAKWAVTTCTTS